MDKFSINFMNLQDRLSKKRAFKLSDVKDRIKKVGFDIVRFVDSQKIDDLWQIHRDGDDEYIVAMYEDQTEKKASTISWRAIPDKAGEHINVFYENSPIKLISIASLGIPAEDAWLVSYSLADKLASSPEFLNSFMKELTSEEKEVLRQANPSLIVGK